MPPPLPLHPHPHHHLLHLLLVLLLLLPHPATPQSPAYRFPALPQTFTTKSACREVYEQCMQAFRDCLADVAGNESGRLGCESYRNDVCEGKIRVGCDSLPNDGGGGGGEETVVGESTFVTLTTGTGTAGEGRTQQNSQQTTQQGNQLNTQQTTQQGNQQTTQQNNQQTTQNNQQPTQETTQQTTQPPTQTTRQNNQPPTTQQNNQPTTPTPTIPAAQPPAPTQPPYTLTLTSTAPVAPPTLATVAIVITTVVASNTESGGVVGESMTRTWTLTSTMTMSRGLVLGVDSGGVRRMGMGRGMRLWGVGVVVAGVVMVVGWV